MLKLYNTLSRRKETLRPRKDKKINLFVCGITPYDFAHIGHARTYIAFDAIVKYLREKGVNVFYLQNITDVDDKIIQRAKERNIIPRKLARQFEKEYLNDMKALKIDSVTKYARATDHIREIISQVERLLKKGFAYQIEDGIYYDISKFKNYGRLSKRTVLQAEDAVSRIDESKEKRNKGDFCLWKFSKTGEPKWSSPWSDGKPGWHIEDTAITEKYLGPQYDIHGGARDLIFPHHEAEIAQMEAISGKKPLVKYWLHSGFLTVRGQKMAKSLGNFITIRDFLKKNPARLLRLLIIKNHYRSPLDYAENLVLQTKRELEKIDEFIGKIQSTKFKNKSKFQILKFERDFEKAMEDDFNTPKAIAAIFELINKGNSLIDQNKLTKSDAKDILEFLKRVDRTFNFIFWKKKKEKIPLKLLSLAKQRQRYREQGQWQKADELRKRIKELGFWVEDTKEGPKIKQI
ncbi:MAG: cysteine--tRNA ligase [bacterium]|nr:cysteine--tRNA ligase [bacterium]